MRIFDVATGKLQSSLELKGADFERVLFSRDGQRLTTRHQLDGKKFYAVWDIATRTSLVSATVTDSVWIRTDGTGFVVRIRKDDTYEHLSWRVDTAASLRLGGWGEMSPDGRRFVSPRAGGGIQLIDALSGRVAAEIASDGAEFQHAVFNAMAAQIAITWVDRQTVDIIDAETGARIKQISTTGLIDRLLLSGDGRTLVHLATRRSSDAEEVFIESWAVASEQHSPQTLLDRRRVLPDGPSGALVRDSIVSLNHDGTRLLMESWDGSLSLWNVRDGSRLSRLTDKRSRFHWGRFSEDGSVLILIGDGEDATLWKTADGQRLGRLIGHTHRVTSFELSPDGAHILTASSDGTARLWSMSPLLPSSVVRFSMIPLAPGMPRIFGNETPQISSVVFNRRANRLIASENNIRTLLWDVGKSRQIALFDFGRQTDEPGFNHRGDHFYIYHDYALIGIYDSETGKLLGEIQPALRSSHPIDRNYDRARLLFAPDDKFAFLISRTKDQGWTETTVAEIWDMTTLRHVAVLQNIRPAYYGRISFDPAGKRFAMAVDKTWKPVIFNYGTWTYSKTLSVEGGPLVWSLDGKRLAVANGIIDVDTEAMLVTRKQDDNCGHIADWSEATGRFVSYFGSDEPIVCLHDSETGALVRGVDSRHLPDVHTRGVVSARFVAKGRRFMTAADDNTVRLWDSSNGQLLAVFGEPVRPMDKAIEIRRLSVSYDVSVDGLRIVTGHDDNSVFVWDAETGAPLAQFRDHKTRIGSVAVDSNGRLIASGSWDETVRIYSIIPDQKTLIARTIAALPRCLDEAQRKAVFLDAMVPDWCYEQNKFGAFPIRLGVVWVQPSDNSIRIPARVARVMRGLPAELGGIRAHDVVVAVNDTVVNSSEEANAAVAKLRSGTVARIAVDRNGSREIVLVTPRF